MAALQTAKKELRKRIKVTLSGLSKDSINAQSTIATRTLLSLPEYEAAKNLSVYLSMPSGEIQTAEIVRDAFNKGKQVYVPYIYQVAATATQEKSSIMEMLALRSVEDYESLQPDKWGIPSLDKDTLAARKNCMGGHGLRGSLTQSLGEESPGLDLIVMPGMAFDEGFGRLGHGKGYYDRFVTRSRGNEKKTSVAQKPYLAALTLQEQLLPSPERVPVGDHDHPVDALIVGDGRVLKRT